MKDTFVYLAGPLTAAHSYTIVQNVSQAIEVFFRLSQIGIHAFCPHLTALVPGAFDIHYEFWMEHDFLVISRCDAMLMLPRWETSSGARREYEFAQSLGKRIFLSEEELLKEFL